MIIMISTPPTPSDIYVGRPHPNSYVVDFFKAFSWVNESLHTYHGND